MSDVSALRNWTLRISGQQLTAGTIAVAGIAGPLASIVGMEGLLALCALPILLVIALRPQFGAYLYLIATPLIVGVARGDTLGVLRPNEALLLLIVLGLVARAFCIMLQGGRYRLQLDGADFALALMATCASLLPLAFRFGRGLPISMDDLLYAIVLWKYFLVFRVFREAIVTPRQVMVCMWLSLAAALAVGLIAVLQVMNLFGVPQLLLAYYDQPFGSGSGVIADRGTSTIASSFGVANVMTMNLAIVVALLAARRREWLPLLTVGGMFVLGSVAAGQFSGLISLVVALLMVGFLTGYLHRLLLVAIPAIGLSALMLWSVVAQRLGGFDTLSGLPPSWMGRLDNLQRFVWPELFSGVNWLVGVRPAARIPAPEAWREWVFIESGYTWLLWSGGVPLLLAFGFFVWASLRRLWRVLQEGAEPVRIAAVASFSWLAAMVVLMLFDPHLTMRGSADLFFPLLAISLVSAPERRVPDNPAEWRAGG